MKNAWVLLLLWTAFGAPVAAHEVIHHISGSEAVTITLTYADGSPFSYESYEVYRPGEETPFQVGRTDRLGRIAFLPDGSGEWRVRAFSEDGHGVDLTFPAGPSSAPAAAGPRSGTDRLSRILFGIGIILGLFGILALFRRRNR